MRLSPWLGASVTLAPYMADRQDDAAHWRAMAERYVAASGPDLSDAPDVIEFASFQVEADETLRARASPRARWMICAASTPHTWTLPARPPASAGAWLKRSFTRRAPSGSPGQAAVAEVVLNRVRHRAYPDTVCDVVYQGSERTTGCQFTFTCDGSMMIAPYGRSWDRSQLVAEHALMGFAQPVTRRATHYHTTEVDPYWNDSLVRTRRIGTHIFYRFPNRSERQLLIREREA